MKHRSAREKLIEESEQGWLAVCISLVEPSSPVVKPDPYNPYPQPSSGMPMSSNAGYYDAKPQAPLGKRSAPNSQILMNAIAKTSPENVKAFLEERGITQNVAAQKLGVAVTRFRSWMNGRGTWNGEKEICDWLRKVQAAESNPLNRPRTGSQQSSSQAMMGSSSGGGYGGAPGGGGGGGPGRPQYNMQDFITALKLTTDKKDHKAINMALTEYLKERRKQHTSTPISQKQLQGKILLQKLKHLCGEQVIIKATAQMKKLSPIAPSHGGMGGGMPGGGMQGGGLSSMGGPPLQQQSRYDLARQNSSTSVYSQGMPGMKPSGGGGGAPPGGAPSGGAAGGRGQVPNKQQIADLIKAWNHGCQCENPKCTDNLCYRIKPSVQHQRELKKKGIEKRPCTEGCKKCIFYMKLCQFSRRRQSDTKTESSNGGAQGRAQVQQQGGNQPPPRFDGMNGTQSPRFDGMGDPKAAEQQMAGNKRKAQQALQSTTAKQKAADKKAAAEKRKEAAARKKMLEQQRKEEQKKLEQQRHSSASMFDSSGGLDSSLDPFADTSMMGGGGGAGATSYGSEFGSPMFGNNNPGGYGGGMSQADTDPFSSIGTPPGDPMQVSRQNSLMNFSDDFASDSLVGSNMGSVAGNRGGAGGGGGTQGFQQEISDLLDDQTGESFLTATDNEVLGFGGLGDDAYDF